MKHSSLLLESYLELFDKIYSALLAEHEWMERHNTPREGEPSEELLTLYQSLENALESFAYFKAKPPLDSKGQALMQQVQNKLMQLMLLAQDNEAAVLRMGLKQRQTQEALLPISSSRVGLVYKST